MAPKTIEMWREKLKKIWVGCIKIRFTLEKCKITRLGKKNSEM